MEMFNTYVKIADSTSNVHQTNEELGLNHTIWTKEKNIVGRFQYPSMYQTQLDE